MFNQQENKNLPVKNSLLCTSNSMLCHDRIQVGKIFVECIYTIQTLKYKYCMKKRIYIYGKLNINIYRLQDNGYVFFVKWNTKMKLKVETKINLL